MIIRSRAAFLLVLLMGWTVAVSSSQGAIEILSPSSTRTFYAQVAGVGNSNAVTIPSLRTDSPLNWMNTSPNLSWTASGDASQTIVFISPPSTEVSSSQNDISLSVNTNDELVMSIESTHSRTAGANQAGFFGNGAEGFYFKLTEATPFTFTSEYVATSSSGKGFSQFQASLTSVASPFTNYFNFNESSSGDHTYSHSATGTLPAGTYQWYQFARIVSGSQPGDRDPAGATGEGFFRLVLANAGSTVDPGVVPEAASLAVWAGLGLIAGIGAWRTRASGRAGDGASIQRSV